MASERHTMAANDVREALLARVRALVPDIRNSAAAAEEARTISRGTADAMLAAGIARILVPRRYGGYGLSFDSWFEVVREIAKADASHGWCASLMAHHAHLVSQLPQAAQEAVWADGPDVSIAASLAPAGRAVPVEGGYRVSGEFPFASGINHSHWLVVGSLVGQEPVHTYFPIAPRAFAIKDTWFTAGMCGTGSNTAICDDVYVPENQTVAVSLIREGDGPGGKLHADAIYHAPWISYAPITFAAPMLGAAQGAYELFVDWTKSRKAGRSGLALAELTSIQVRLARAASDLDAAELLLRRAIDVAAATPPPSLALRGRALRDCSRVAELCVGVIDTLVGMGGTAVFATSHPIQRAWRDLHFAAMHAVLNPEQNFAYYGRGEFGLPRDPYMPFF
jgi:3-hydroxy-9,10-secoandrosta-1,3,5(10)-triene-9,17-dione monooxygenase